MGYKDIALLCVLEVILNSTRPDRKAKNRWVKNGHHAVNVRG